MSEFFKPRYGVAREDRDVRQKIADENWSPITSTSEHKYDEKIAALEAETKKAERDAKFRELKTEKERELFTLKERRATDLDKADATAERAKLLQPVAKEIKALQELRAKLADDPNTTVSRLVQIDRALQQYEAVASGVDRRHADKLYAEIQKHEAQLVADRKRELTEQRVSLEAEIAKLDSAIESPNAEPEPVPKVDVPANATLVERAGVLFTNLKERADTLGLIAFIEAQDDPKALQSFVDEHTVTAEPESSTVVDDE